LYPKADSLICNSQGNATDLVDNFGINPRPIKVIHNPIDIESIRKIEPLDNFFNTDYFNVVTIGRMDAGKNHELLIKAIEQYKNVRLYILGDGHLRNHLEQITKDLNIIDQVFFLGFDSNPYKYLKNADLFMFGSNHEGFPNVCIEALCCGLPLLTTNCKSGPDEILELKEPKTDDIMITQYGILTPTNNLTLMKKGLDYFLQNPDYIEQCRELVVERVKDFEKNKILENYETVLLEKII
jgi:N-acetylgalactosamine-N,N'-diacetylbacillosaminyl-diphospho-undecaprenol 4-alpha-N-acetylgalactosaminyltransferase